MLQDDVKDIIFDKNPFVKLPLRLLDFFCKRLLLQRSWSVAVLFQRSYPQNVTRFKVMQAQPSLKRVASDHTLVQPRLEQFEFLPDHSSLGRSGLDMIPLPRPRQRRASRPQTRPRSK